jgi:hypothetical protein
MLLKIPILTLITPVLALFELNLQRKDLLAAYLSDRGAVADESNVHGLVDTLDWHVLKQKLEEKYGEKVVDEHLHIGKIYGSIASTTLSDPKLQPSVRSLLSQTQKLDALYVVTPSPASRSIGRSVDVPEWLRQLETDKVIIVHAAVDYGPANKLLHTIQRPEIAGIDAIITFESGNVYANNVVVQLASASIKHPETAIVISGWNADRLDAVGRMLTSTGDRREPLAHHAGTKTQEGFVDIIGSRHGVLYKKHFFDEMWIDFANYPKECKFADEIWFSCQLERNFVDKWSITQRAHDINRGWDMRAKEPQRTHNDTVCLKALQEAHGVFNGQADEIIDRQVQFMSKQHEMQFRMIADEL